MSRLPVLDQLCGITDEDVHRKGYQLYSAGIIFRGTTDAHLLLLPHILPLTHVSVSTTDNA